MKRIIIFALLTLTFFLGCNGNPQGRLPVSGTVILDGVPLAEGQISFEPVGEQTLKLRSGTFIKDGKYSVPEASGLVPGEYLVSMACQQPTGKTVKGLFGEMVPEMADVIPPEYGAASKQRVTVTDNGKQVFDFDMKK